MSIKSILLVDDEEGQGEMLAHLLKEQSAATVIWERFPSRALERAMRDTFDLVVADVTMHYNGTPYGGLELGRVLAPRYGANGIIVYSQYVTDDLLKQYDYHFTFVERSANPLAFVEKLYRVALKARTQQTCFVAMPFSASSEPLFAPLERAILANGYRCVRIDKQPFTRSIIEQMLMELHGSKLVVFLTKDQNPNVYYEAGYAVALKKEVITVTDTYADLPFDIRDRNALQYAGDLGQLEILLQERIRSLTQVQTCGPHNLLLRAR